MEEICKIEDRQLLTRCGDFYTVRHVKVVTIYGSNVNEYIITDLYSQKFLSLLQHDMNLSKINLA